jgi:zinc transport system substrate-binding protein
VAIEPEGKEPSSREIARIIAMAREEGIRVVFTEPQFPAREGMVIAREINGTVTVIDPLAPDYLANEVRVARAIAAGGAGNGG